MDSKKIRIGSRESRLAVIQSELIIEGIKKADPDVDVELVTMKTTGDLILNKPLEQIGGKGLFVKELDAALSENRCDLTVHSLKDMPMETPESLPIVAYSKRDDVRDVLVLREGLKELPPAPVIGTSSKRRSLQAAKLFPKAIFKGIRGNLTTRVGKLDSGEYDALILAAAGLRRQGMENRISRYFSTDEIIPAAGQGIMAVQGRLGDEYGFIERINSKEAQITALAERAFVRTLDGGCSSPIAAYAHMGEAGELSLKGLYYDERTGGYLTGTMKGTIDEPETLGTELALSLKKDWKNGKDE